MNITRPISRYLLPVLLTIAAAWAEDGNISENPDWQQHCNEPVYLLVSGDIYDRKAFAAYVTALGESGLYPEYKGYYRAITPALTVLEGEPPKTRGTLLAKFPCQQAVEHFWQSPRYQEIRKLREGIADFEVTVMKALPVPAFIDWESPRQ